MAKTGIFKQGTKKEFFDMVNAGATWREIKEKFTVDEDRAMEKEVTTKEMKYFGGTKDSRGYQNKRVKFYPTKAEAVVAAASEIPEDKLDKKVLSDDQHYCLRLDSHDYKEDSDGEIEVFDREDYAVNPVSTIDFRTSTIQDFLKNDYSTRHCSMTDLEFYEAYEPNAGLKEHIEAYKEGEVCLNVEKVLAFLDEPCRELNNEPLRMVHMTPGDFDNIMTCYETLEERIKFAYGDQTTQFFEEVFHSNRGRFVNSSDYILGRVVPDEDQHGVFEFDKEAIIYLHQTPAGPKEVIEFPANLHKKTIDYLTSAIKSNVPVTESMKEILEEKGVFKKIEDMEKKEISKEKRKSKEKEDSGISV